MGSEPSTELSTARILIVDDEDYICTILARWLGTEGYQCTVAQDADEALAVLAGDAGYELLISDIMMPGLSGIDLLQRVRESYAGLAVIMATGLDKRDVAIRTLQLGAYGYVIKPFDKNELIISVAGALERRRLALESQAYEERLREEVSARTADIRAREEEIALRLVSASEYRDEETGSHIRRMGVFSATLARALHWETQAVEMIRVAAPMHDVGKIGVPDKILLKPGKLTAEEFEKIKEHTIIGAKILGGSTIGLLQMATDIALYHHEKWNGAGYLHGLAGEEIPEAARIVAVADVYDALSNDRVYREALPEEEVLAIMTEGRGSHFDPRVFDQFLELLPTFREVRQKVADEAEPRMQGELKG